MIVSRREKAANGFFIVVIIAIAAMTLGVLLRGQAEKPQQAQAAPSAATLEARISQFSKLLKTAPNDVAALVGLGDAYLDSNRAMEAFKLFQKAVELEPGNVHALSDLASLYQQIGKYDMAIESYRTAYEAQPDHTGSLLNMALIYGRHKKEYPKALELLQTFLNNNPEPQLIANAEQEIARIKQAMQQQAYPNAVK